ncbi:HEAT repeat domain-containing protein [Micromonospora sp. NPDC049903]|uniref:HEAT repeat domain-containing protein n=1 Tax=Micromonospora sp. NPDC049903 TaxID=3364276 RepID=UPI00379FA6C9
MLEVLVTVGLGALGNIIADAVAATGAHQHNRRDPERVALGHVSARALSTAFAAACHEDLAASPEWMDAVAADWGPVFTADVAERLMAVIAAPSPENQRLFGEALRDALRDAGRDPDMLEQTLSIEEFVHAFPQHLWQELTRAAVTQSDLRDLAQLLYRRRADHHDAGLEPAGPRQRRRDLLDYLRAVLRDTRGTLPPFLPHDRAAHLHQRVRVRLKARLADRSSGEQTDRAYQPPVEFAGLDDADSGTERSWTELRNSAPWIVVLSDPGLGKSWLVRNETVRLAMEALQALDEDRDAVVPVPIRADQLAEVLGRSLGDAAARHAVSQDQLAERSQTYFAEQVDAGRAVLLVDGLDEVPDPAARQRVRAALAACCRRPSAPRWLVTSRIAGYTGIESPDAAEIELLSLTGEQVVAYVHAWGLDDPARGRLLKAVTDPAVAGMARIPLLLGLLCSLAGNGQDIPRTRTDLYGRMLRWFLERPHRGPDRSGPADQALLDLLQGVAFHFAARGSGWADLMPGDALTRIIRESPMLRELGGTAGQVVDQLVVDLGILVPEGDASRGRRARYLFAHRTFAEYLVACYLAALDEPDRWEIIECHLWFDPEWLQVISMLGGLLEADEARRLVGWLSDRDDDAFRQAWLMEIRVISEHPQAADLLTPAARDTLHQELDRAVRHPDLRWTVVTALRGISVPAAAVVRPLLRLTEDPDEGVRLAAVRSLAAVDTPPSTAHLLARLDDTDEQVVVEAAKALAGRTSPSVLRALLERASDERWRVAEACAASLRALPVALRVQTVAPCLAADQPAAVRAACYAVLHGAGPEALEMILAGLADEDPDVFVAAAKAVKSPLHPRAEALLLRRLDTYLAAAAAGDDIIIWDGPAGHRRDADAQAARAALDRCGSQAPGFTAAYLCQVIDRDDTLDHFGRDTGPVAPTPELVDALVQRLRHPGGPQHRAARVLRAMRPADIDDALLGLLSSGDVALVGPALVAAFGRRDERLVAAITALLADPHDGIRASAMEALVEADPPGLAEILPAALRDRAPQVRRLAVGACAGRDDTGLTVALLERIRMPGEHEGVVVAAIEALRGREQEPDVREVLLACLRGETEVETEQQYTPGSGLFVHLGPSSRVAAATALTQVEPDAVLAELTARSGMENGYVGREVAWALLHCRAPGTVEFLLLMRRNGARKTRIAAHNVLLSRGYEEDLVTIADQLAAMPAEILHDMLGIALRLGEQHYLKLSGTDRLRVRRQLTAAVTAGEPLTRS